MTLILASGSESRRAILSAASVPFEAATPDVDEAPIKATLLEQGAGAEAIALALAGAKATSVSSRRRDALVLGCDQILECGGRLFDKAPTIDAAREVLRALRGKEHRLVTTALLMRGGQVVWQHVETPRLWMRAFSDAFLEAYLEDEGEDILGSVGCYRVEGRGAQLFTRIEGDQFSIRGLPLIPLLSALREQGALPA